MKYKINVLAKLLNVTTNTIRRYEESGFIKSERDESGYRWYTEEDISLVTAIRLYSKCGFGHKEINGMLKGDNELVKGLCTDRLDELDKEMARLKALRHWLKDNLQLMETVDTIGEGYVTMTSPQLIYIIYGQGETYESDPQRLKCLNSFLNDVPEVQLFRLYKKEEIEQGIFTAQKGCSIKQLDIKRLNLKEEDFLNEYTSVYASLPCIYGVIKSEEGRLTREQCADYCKRLYDFMEKNDFKPIGDLMAIRANSLGKTRSFLMCMPVGILSTKAAKVYGELSFKQ